MQNVRLPAVLILAACLAAACASPLQVDTATFSPPATYPGHQTYAGLEIAVDPIADPARCEEIFGTDLKTAGVLPVQLIVQNAGMNEIEINHTQIYGVQPDNTYAVAYTLNRTAQNVRQSSIGTTAASNAAGGALLGAAIGAGLGAAAGSAGGDAGTGAAIGASLGGATGGSAGLAHGLSDSITIEFKKQLASLAFEDRVIFPGDLQQGFIYLKRLPYSQIRMKLFNITQNEVKELFFAVTPR